VAVMSPVEILFQFTGDRTQGQQITVRLDADGKYSTVEDEALLGNYEADTDEDDDASDSAEMETPPPLLDRVVVGSLRDRTARMNSLLSQTALSSCDCSLAAVCADARLCEQLLPASPGLTHCRAHCQISHTLPRAFWSRSG
jgi:hypothetical protein